MGVTVPNWVEEAPEAALQLGHQLDAAAVALVGSYARAQARPDSDLDLVLLVRDPTAALSSSAWFALFGRDVSLTRTEDFGGVQERRLATPEGHEIEVCIGDPTWASVDPVDVGTASVVRDGLRPVYDPHGLLAKLLAAVDV